MTPTDSDEQDWRVGLARLEGKVDALLTGVQGLSTSVVHIDKRVRDLETAMAGVKVTLADIERAEPPKVNWAGVLSALAAVIAVLLVLADRVYESGGTP